MINIKNKILTLKDQNVTVLGAGVSGVYVSALATSYGANVLLSDSQDMDLTVDQFTLLSKHGVRIENNGHSEDVFTSDFVIKSPGVPHSSEIVKKILRRDIPIISEVEFAYQLLNSDRIIAITGSHGKSITAKILLTLLKNTGHKVHSASGPQNPLSKVILEEVVQEDDFIILELNSFQLEDTYSFHPYISVFLNIAKDKHDNDKLKIEHHLDIKLRIAQHQRDDDKYLFWEDDIILKKNKPAKVSTIAFGLNTKENGIYVKENHIYYNDEKLIAIDELLISGDQNLLNLLAALNICKILNIECSQLLDSVKKLQIGEEA